METLYDKIKDFRDSHQNPVNWLEIKDVKEFIRELKKPIIAEIKIAELADGDIAKTSALLLNAIVRSIDELAGDKLI